MAWFIGQSLLIILAAFLFGLLVGWIVWGNRKSSPSSSGDTFVTVSEQVDGMVAASRGRAIRPNETDAHQADDEAVPHDAHPMTMDEASSTELHVVPNDDLERIEGIGPQMAAALRTAGIHSFSQLANTDDNTRRAAIEAAGLTFAPSLVTWARQAQLLADGDEDGFVELTERLVAGRDTGRA